MKRTLLILSTTLLTAAASAQHSDAEIKQDIQRHRAMAAAMDLARTANGYVEERQPWTQAKDPAHAAELDETLATLARALVALAALFEPVAPAKMVELVRRLGLDRVPVLAQARNVALAGQNVHKGPPLFPKADVPSGEP